MAITGSCNADYIIKTHIHTNKLPSMKKKQRKKQLQTSLKNKPSNLPEGPELAKNNNI